MKLRQTVPLLAGLLLSALLATGAAAQTREVKGTVIDENEQPLAGATVTVKGETRGVMTDGAGRFTITVKPTDYLAVMFLGYNDEEIAVGTQKDLLIKMVPQANTLDEVVMVAYGAQKKASVIGSISTVNMEQLQTSIGQLSTGLAGKLAGIVAMQRTGEPGSSAEFWIRGVSTFGGASTTPLILVDGVERSMDMVDVEDIATFSILKDATATALYGVRGANGIVLITTRRGAESAPKVTFRAESGITSPTRLPRMADTAQFIDYLNELWMDQGSGMAISNWEKELYLSGADPDLYPSVDWIHSIFKDQALNHRVNVNVTGGTKNVRYYVGGSYYYEDGIFNVANNDRYSAQMDYNKFNFRTNVDINITKSTVLAMNLSTQFTTKHSPGGGVGNIYIYTLQNTPVAMPLIFSDGTLSATNGTENPYNQLNESGYITTDNNVAQSTISLTQDLSEMITEGLSAKVQVSWDATNTTTLNRTILPKTYYVEKRNEDGSLDFQVRDNYAGYITLSTGRSGQTALNLEASTLYERQFAGAHRVSGMFMFDLRTRTNTVPGSYIAAFPYKHLGFAGRATYAYRDRYFAEVNFGYNGSEQFSPGHRFGFFPSYAVGYIISNEPFWNGIKDAVSLLKFKASYGHIGNDNIGGSRRFAYNTTINTSAGGANWGSEQAIYVGGITTGDYGNPAVEWEKAIKSNIGLELNLFRDKLKFQADYFYDRREGIFLLRQSTPSVAGVNVQQYENIGRMKNSGVDMSLQYDHTFSNGLWVSSRANYTFNRNRRIYDDQPSQVWPYRNLAGFVNDQQRGLIAEGLFRDQDEIDAWPSQMFGLVRPGDIKYRDINGDGVITDDDQVAIGYTTIPEINYGFGLSLGWKGVDASVFFSGVNHVTRIIGGQNLYGGAASNIKTQGQVFADVVENSWSVSKTDEENAAAVYPRLSIAKNENNRQPSTWWQRDMSFIRLKNAELGYTLPKNWSRKAGLSTVRIYVQGTNLLTFSKFKLWDPELNSSFGNVYPTTKNVSFGVNVNF